MPSINSATTAQLADPRALVAKSLSALLPPARISTSDYAAAHRWLNNPGSYVGRWRHEETPYLTGPMDALDSPYHHTTVVVGPGRSGKTAVAENWLQKSVGADAANFLWYLSSEPALQAYVKQEINPMIELHDDMRSRLGPRPIDDSIGFKRFRAMTAQFLTAAPNNLISKTATRIVLDEIDAYAENLGDAYALADVRRQSAGMASMIYACSHPDRAGGLSDRHWTAGIMRLYAGSDRRMWYWPCPHCGAYSSPNPAAARVMTLEYPADADLDEIEAETRLLCPTCGGLIEDFARRAMNQAGKWVGLGQEIDEDGTVSGPLVDRKTAGFWIVGLMSPFVLGGIGGLARALQEARRNAELTGADEGLRTVTVKRFGIPYDPPRRVGSLDAESLADRAEEFPLGIVPDGVRFLTAFADVQANRFEVTVRGWGVSGESWIVDRLTLPGDTATSPADWDAMLARLLDHAWPLHGDAGRAMKLRAMGYDSGGAPGVTAQAYDAWRRLRKHRATRMLGKVDGRDAWSVLPCKGFGTPNAPRLQVTYPDSARRDRNAAARGQVPVAQFSANLFKDDLAGQLARAAAGAWSVHFPTALRAAAPPHPFFEGLVTETRRRNGAWEHTGSARNEPIDMMVGCHVVAHLHGLARLNWERPPAWAAEWDRNPMVIPVDAAAIAPASTPGPSAIVQPAPAQAPPLASMAMPHGRSAPIPAPAFNPAAYNPAARRGLASKLA